MTHTYALKRLLEHGELSISEMFEITGWKKKQVSRTVEYLQKQKIIRRYPKMKWGLVALNPYPYEQVG
jgi:DNA-binding transcriptional regulator GbsR (MarR family)